MIHATTQVNLEDIMLRNKTDIQGKTYTRVHLYEVPSQIHEDNSRMLAAPD